MKLALLCLVLCLGTRCGAHERGYVYNRDVDAWLRLHLVPAAWSDAAMRCYLEGCLRDIGELDCTLRPGALTITSSFVTEFEKYTGGLLASPTDSAMSQAMMAMMAEQQLTRSVYTGINSILARENFTSLEGVPLVDMQLKWAADEPDNANSDEDCLAMTGAGTVADVSCGSKLPYFCRKQGCQQINRGYTILYPNIRSGSPGRKNTRCGSKGYEYEARTGSCYKFHRVAKNWRPAVAACHAEGGYLAVINDVTEYTVLKELYAKNSEETIVRADEHRHAFIGFRKWDDGEWATLYGVTLEEVGFTGWDYGEPSNGNGDRVESCGSIHRNGQLNDAPCEQICPFICEMNPK